MSDFYDDIAGRYDEITGAGERGQAATAFVKELLQRFTVSSALDVACGTGLYTFPLARAGVHTAGADLSAGMLAQAQSRAQQAGLAIEWVCLPMQQLAASVRQRFDAILCMGNSLPHLLTDADLDAALGGFVKLLNPGGVVILQLLNYVRVLGEQERIVGIDRRGDREYVRFYDFMADRVRFNILEIQWKDATAKHELHSTMLRPYTAGELTAALARAGCEPVETFGGLAFAPFASDASQTVMLVGHADEG